MMQAAENAITQLGLANPLSLNGFFSVHAIVLSIYFFDPVSSPRASGFRPGFLGVFVGIHDGIRLQHSATD